MHCLSAEQSRLFFFLLNTTVWFGCLHCRKRFCCVNLVFKGSVSLRESSDLDGSFHSLFLWSVNGSICVWLRHKIWVRTNPQRGMKIWQCNSGREGEGREGKKVRVCCGVRVGGSQIFEQWSYQNDYVLSSMCSCALCPNSHVISIFTCRLLLRTNSLCFTTIKSFNPSVSNALPKCRAIAPFLFPSQYHCVVWVSALPQKVLLCEPCF